MRILVILLALGACFAHAQNPAPYTFNLVSTNIWISQAANEFDPRDTVFAKIRFSIEAINQDVWFWRYSHETLDAPANNGIWWNISNASNGEAVQTYASTSTLARVSGGSSIGNAWSVSEGETAVYELSTYFQPSAPGAYRFEADQLRIASSFGQLATIDGATPIELPSDLRTDAIFARSVPEPTTATLLLVVGSLFLGAKRRRE